MEEDDRVGVFDIVPPKETVVVGVGVHGTNALSPVVVQHGHDIGAADASGQ